MANDPTTPAAINSTLAMRWLNLPLIASAAKNSPTNNSNNGLSMSRATQSGIAADHYAMGAFHRWQAVDAACAQGSQILLSGALGYIRIARSISVRTATPEGPLDR